jgi:hypothetical protein
MMNECNRAMTHGLRMNTVTLINGHQVDSDSEEWRKECEQRDRHIQNLRRCQTRQDRIEYLQRLTKAEGDEAARRVKERFEVVWKQSHPG